MFGLWLKFMTIHLCEFKVPCPECGHLTATTFSLENDLFWIECLEAL